MPTLSASPRSPTLPLQLAITMMPWLASLETLAHLKNVSNGLKTPPVSRLLGARKLSEACAEMEGDPLLARAVEKQARKKVICFLEGLQRYRQSSFARDIEEPARLV